MNQQQKNITKTILMIVAIMVTFLTLFLNKITTPRYLSDIELRINGLVLLSDSEKRMVELSASSDQRQWLLVASNEAEQQQLSLFHQQLKKSIKKQVEVVDRTAIGLTLGDEDVIELIRPDGEYFAYFKPPFDDHKMTLTLASVVTHR